MLDGRLMKRITDALIKQKKTEYVERAKVLGKKNGKFFYKMVKEVGCNERPRPWTPNKIYPGESDSQVAGHIVDYFGSISDLLPKLDRSKAPAGLPEVPFGPFTKTEVQIKLV